MNCSPQRIVVLESGRIMLTRAGGFNDPFELKPPHHEHHRQHRLRQVHRRPDEEFCHPLLRSLDNRASLLMWAHYAASYSGFLIGFDADEKILAVDSPHRDFGPVVYSHSKPSKPTFGDISNLELFCWKSSEWVYDANGASSIRRLRQTANRSYRPATAIRSSSGPKW